MGERVPFSNANIKQAKRLRKRGGTTFVYPPPKKNLGLKKTESVDRARPNPDPQLWSNLHLFKQTGRIVDDGHRNVRKQRPTAVLRRRGERALIRFELLLERGEPVAAR